MDDSIRRLDRDCLLCLDSIACQPHRAGAMIGVMIDVHHWSRTSEGMFGPVRPAVPSKNSGLVAGTGVTRACVQGLGPVFARNDPRSHGCLRRGTEQAAPCASRKRSIEKPAARLNMINARKVAIRRASPLSSAPPSASESRRRKNHKSLIDNEAGFFGGHRFTAGLGPWR